jgi:F420-dependent oxidoreductase-like protein
VKVSIGFGAPFADGVQQWDRAVEFVVEAEKLGVDSAWSAEAWGTDAVTPLAYLAAKTSRIHLGTGIMQISARAPSMTAMTALTLASLSRGRFRLGLGASGPQVVEGLHGVRFAKPLERLREHLEIVRAILRGEAVRYQGKHYVLPLPGGEGKPIRVAQPPNPAIPIYLATLGPASLELTGELADGWLGTSFVPEAAAEQVLPHLARGAAKSGRQLADLDLCVGASVEFGDDVERMIAARKPGMAFTLGAMGSRRHNFYNAAYQRAGYADVAAEVQQLWLEGKRDLAASRIPDEMVLRTSLLGNDAAIRERMRSYRDAGITTLRLDPGGRTASERLDTLARAMDLVREVSAERGARA